MPELPRDGRGNAPLRPAPGVFSSRKGGISDTSYRVDKVATRVTGGISSLDRDLADGPRGRQIGFPKGKFSGSLACDSSRA
jgi:hypothetical protein